MPVELPLKFRYGFLALLELADHYHTGEPLQLRQIAVMSNIPERYLEQLLTALKGGGLVKSQRGAKGGYVLAKAPSQIVLLDALACLEGCEAKAEVERTTLKTADSLLIHEIWQEASQAARSVWQKYMLQDLYERQKAQHQTNIMYYI